jgi:hypothetical protein
MESAVVEQGGKKRRLNPGVEIGRSYPTRESLSNAVGLFQTKPSWGQVFPANSNIAASLRKFKQTNNDVFTYRTQAQEEWSAEKDLVLVWASELRAGQTPAIPSVEERLQNTHGDDVAVGANEAARQMDRMLVVGSSADEIKKAKKNWKRNFGRADLQEANTLLKARTLRPEMEGRLREALARADDGNVTAQPTAQHPPATPAPPTTSGTQAASTAAAAAAAARTSGNDGNVTAQPTAQHPPATPARQRSALWTGTRGELQDIPFRTVRDAAEGDTIEHSHQGDRRENVNQLLSRAGSDLIEMVVKVNKTLCDLKAGQTLCDAEEHKLRLAVLMSNTLVKKTTELASFLANGRETNSFHPGRRPVFSTPQHASDNAYRAPGEDMRSVERQPTLTHSDANENQLDPSLAVATVNTRTQSISHAVEFCASLMRDAVAEASITNARALRFYDDLRNYGLRNGLLPVLVKAVLGLKSGYSLSNRPESKLLTENNLVGKTEFGHVAATFFDLRVLLPLYLVVCIDPIVWQYLMIFPRQYVKSRFESLVQDGKPIVIMCVQAADAAKAFTSASSNSVSHTSFDVMMAPSALLDEHQAAIPAGLSHGSDSYDELRAVLQRLLLEYCRKTGTECDIDEWYQLPRPRRYECIGEWLVQKHPWVSLTGWVDQAAPDDCRPVEQTPESGSRGRSVSEWSQESVMSATQDDASTGSGSPLVRTTPPSVARGVVRCLDLGRRRGTRSTSPSVESESQSSMGEENASDNSEVGADDSEVDAVPCIPSSTATTARLQHWPPNPTPPSRTSMKHKFLPVGLRGVSEPICEPICEPRQLSFEGDSDDEGGGGAAGIEAALDNGDDGGGVTTSGGGDQSPDVGGSASAGETHEHTSILEESQQLRWKVAGGFSAAASYVFFNRPGDIVTQSEYEMNGTLCSGALLALFVVFFIVLDGSGLRSWLGYEAASAGDKGILITCAPASQWKGRHAFPAITHHTKWLREIFSRQLYDSMQFCDLAGLVYGRRPLLRSGVCTSIQDVFHACCTPAKTIIRRIAGLIMSKYGSATLRRWQSYIVSVLLINISFYTPNGWVESVTIAKAGWCSALTVNLWMYLLGAPPGVKWTSPTGSVIDSLFADDDEGHQLYIMLHYMLYHFSAACTIMFSRPKEYHQRKGEFTLHEVKFVQIYALLFSEKAVTPSIKARLPTIAHCIASIELINETAHAAGQPGNAVACLLTLSMSPTESAHRARHLNPHLYSSIELLVLSQAVSGLNRMHSLAYNKCRLVKVFQKIQKLIDDFEVSAPFQSGRQFFEKNKTIVHGWAMTIAHSIAEYVKTQGAQDLPSTITPGQMRHGAAGATSAEDEVNDASAGGQMDQQWEAGGRGRQRAQSHAAAASSNDASAGEQTDQQRENEGSTRQRAQSHAADGTPDHAADAYALLLQGELRDDAERSFSGLAIKIGSRVFNTGCQLKIDVSPYGRACMRIAFTTEEKLFRLDIQSYMVGCWFAETARRGTKLKLVLDAKPRTASCPTQQNNGNIWFGIRRTGKSLGSALDKLRRVPSRRGNDERHIEIDFETHSSLTGALAAFEDFPATFHQAKAAHDTDLAAYQHDETAVERRANNDEVEKRKPPALQDVSKCFEEFQEVARLTASEVKLKCTNCHKDVVMASADYVRAHPGHMPGNLPGFLCTASDDHLGRLELHHLCDKACSCLRTHNKQCRSAGQSRDDQSGEDDDDD